MESPTSQDIQNQVKPLPCSSLTFYYLSVVLLPSSDEQPAESNSHPYPIRILPRLGSLQARHQPGK